MQEPNGNQSELSPSRTFARDLVESARTLRRTPRLVATTLLLSAAFAGDLVAGELDRRWRDTCVRDTGGVCGPHAWTALVSLVYLPMSFFLLGFNGTQRVWFMRARDGADLDRGQVWRMSWSFLGRYFVLGWLAAPILAVAAIPAIVHQVNAPDEPFSVGILFFVVIFVLEVLATFIAPALAFSTRRVRVAIPSGVKILARSWPQSFWYAVAPPLTLLVFGANTIRRSFGLTSVIIITGLVAPLIGLWTKSATALFYLRRVPAVRPDGAAYLASRTCVNGHGVAKGASYCSVCGVELIPRR